MNETMLHTGCVHTAPLTNLSVVVDICQLFTMLLSSANIQKIISVSVGSHLSTPFFQTSVYLNIHLERRICKPPFLCVFVWSSVSGFRKTEV